MWQIPLFNEGMWFESSTAACYQGHYCHLEDKEEYNSVWAQQWGKKPNMFSISLWAQINSYQRIFTDVYSSQKNVDGSLSSQAKCVMSHRCETRLIVDLMIKSPCGCRFIDFRQLLWNGAQLAVKMPESNLIIEEHPVTHIYIYSSSNALTCSCL